MQQLQGKTALVTGSARGIGRAVAERFAKEGAGLYVHARAGSPDFEKWADGLTNTYGVAVRPVFFDLTDTDAMRSAMELIAEGEGAPDILVNNAGVSHAGLFFTTPVQEIRRVFDVNLFAAMELTQILLRGMIRRRQGCIINISSVMATDPVPGNTAYGASKAALRAWTENLAAEVVRSGIRVNAIAPGPVEGTGTVSAMRQTPDPDTLRRRAPGNRFCRAEEVAAVAAFLASEDASFVNGQTIVVNGGAARLPYTGK